MDLSEADLLAAQDKLAGRAATASRYALLAQAKAQEAAEWDAHRWEMENQARAESLARKKVENHSRASR